MLIIYTRLKRAGRLHSGTRAYVPNSVFCLALGLIFPLTNVPQARALETPKDSDVQTNETITVHVQSAEGKPLSGLTVVFANYATNNGPRQGYATLQGITLHAGFKQLVTDADGGFPLSANGPQVVLAIAGESGFALAESRDLGRKPVMIVHAWGRIEGVRMNRNRPVVGARIHLSPAASGFTPGTVDTVDMGAETTTDAQGRFNFDHVPALDIHLGERLGPEDRVGATGYVSIGPGGTNQVSLYTDGRTVTGQFVAPEDEAGWTNFAGVDMDLIWDVPESNLRPPQPPPQLDSTESRLKWYRDFYHNTESGRGLRSALGKHRRIDVHDDGSFTGIMVEPGKYRLVGRRIENGFKLLDFDLPIVIPASSAETGDEPLNLGRIVLRPINNLQPGALAPDFSFTSLEGQPFKLSDFRGKFILLDFWATWCGPCIGEIPNLKATFDEFGGDKRFTIMSLSMDADREAPKKFVSSRDLPWIHAFVGDAFDSSAARNYPLSSIPKLFLVGPDSKLIGCYLRGPDIKKAVAKALAK
jgi:thiol-disulfide isomerase/thioredoxin